MPTTTLTDRAVKGARVPEGRRQYDLRDDSPRGLILRVYESGRKVWGLLYRRLEDDRRRWYKLGDYPGLGLAAARVEATKALGRVAKGADPQGEREDSRRARAKGTGSIYTVEDLVEHYLEKVAPKTNRSSTIESYRYLAESYVIPELGREPIATVSRRDISRLLKDAADGTITPSGQPTTTVPRLLRAFLSVAFEWAVSEAELLPASPAAGVKLPRGVPSKVERDRVLSRTEIATLWREIDLLDARIVVREPPLSAAVLRLILLTAQRPGEVLSMRWSDLSPKVTSAADVKDAQWWTVPKHVAKNGIPNLVYLAPLAREILARLYQGEEGKGVSRRRKDGGKTGSWEGTGGRVYVFASPRKDDGSPLSDVKGAHRSILKRGEVEHWRPHDLRRTAATEMRRMGIDSDVVEAILNHKPPGVRRVYDLYEQESEIRDALTRWAARLEVIAEGRELEGELVAFPVGSAS